MINIAKLAAVARATTKPKVVSPIYSDQISQEKMSRRAALRRIGMTSGIAVLGLLTIDDLARVASKKLEQNELTRGIAKDFKGAGVAFADTWEGGFYSTDLPRYYPPACQGGTASNCTACNAAQYGECIRRGHGAAHCRLVQSTCSGTAVCNGTDDGSRASTCWALEGRVPGGPVIQA